MGLSVQQLSESFGLNMKIIRFIIHEFEYPTTMRNRSLRQPFFFMKSKYVKKVNVLLQKIPEEVKQFYADSVEAHKNMSYEERGQQQEGLKITYPILLDIYESRNIPKSKFQEPNVYKKFGKTDQQVQELLALEMADIKMKQERVIYADIIQLKQTDFSLEITTYDVNQGYEMNPKSQYLWLIGAFDTHTGVFGYQILKERPVMAGIMKFVEKLADKIVVQLQNTPPNEENPEEGVGAWLVMKQSHLFINKYVEAALIRGNLRLLPTFTDEHNLKLNAACGVWQYLSQIWETNIQKGDLVGDQMPLLDNIVQCFKDMDNQCVKLIADAYNNNQILELLGNKKEAQKSIINQETNGSSVIQFSLELIGPIS